MSEPKVVIYDLLRRAHSQSLKTGNEVAFNVYCSQVTFVVGSLRIGAKNRVSSGIKELLSEMEWAARVCGDMHLARLTLNFHSHTITTRAGYYPSFPDFLYDLALSGAMDRVGGPRPIFFIADASGNLFAYRFVAPRSEIEDLAEFLALTRRDIEEEFDLKAPANQDQLNLLMEKFFRSIRTKAFRKFTESRLWRRSKWNVGALGELLKPFGCDSIIFSEDWGE